MQYCKVIILTSMVWVMVDVFVLMYFTDCTTGNAGCQGNIDGVAVGRSHKEESKGFLEKIIPKGRWWSWLWLFFFVCKVVSDILQIFI